MVKHTQTIRRQIADELFECVWPICEIGAKRVNEKLHFLCSDCNCQQKENYPMNGACLTESLVYYATIIFNYTNYNLKLY